MATDDQDRRWGRQLLTGLGALVVTTLLIGLVVGAGALGAVRMLGLGDPSPRARTTPSLYLPSGTPTTSPEAYPDPVAPSSGGEASPTPSQSPTPSGTANPRRKPISLQAFPARVSPGERINLTGVYRAGEGTTVQVQRKEGGSWADFPVSATVRGGIFATYVTTSRTGALRFRVVDVASGRASNPVIVTVG